MFKLSFLLGFCFVAIALAGEDLPPEVKQMIQNLHNTCVGETGVSEADIAAANKGNFAKDEKLQCYMKCLMSSVGIIDDDGAMDMEAYIDLLPESMKENGRKVAEACKDKGGANACEIAYNLNTCAYGVNPSVYNLY